MSFGTDSIYKRQREISLLLDKCGRNAAFYLAAAVSDFYIPIDKMEQHKIQSSGKESLKLELDHVPKILRRLVKEWAKDAFIVSFKLETDPALLQQKALAALSNYGHQVVIGNILDTRKRTVTLFSNLDSKKIDVTEKELSAGCEIEEKIVSELVRRHDEWVKQG